jgi:hypothetical protein
MKIHITKIKLAILAMLFALTAKAQFPIDTTGLNTHSWRCGNDSVMFSTILGNPDFMGAMATYDNAILSKTTSTLSVGPYIVPVVFHIITSTATTVPTYEQIKWQVAALNAAFQAQMLQFTGNSAGPYAAFTNIEFRLACTPTPTTASWSNSAEPGVMRYVTSNTVILNQAPVTPSSSPTMYTPMLNLTNQTSGYFPKANYLNIYCVPSIANSGSGTIVGFATFPSWQPSFAFDGVVMRLDAIGNNTYPTAFPLNPYFDRGFTLAHEVGHYLGLYHTFETAVSGSLTASSPGCFGTAGTITNTLSAAYTDGDMVYDTPPTATSGDLGSLTSVNSCIENYQSYINYTGTTNYTGYDQSDQLENFMCYSHDTKTNTFTNKQASRMWGAFDSNYGPPSPPRSVLTSTANLSATGVIAWPTSCANKTEIVTGIFNYAIAPASSCTAVTIQFTNPISLGFNVPGSGGTSYSWNFGDPASGGLNTSSIANPTHTYTNQTTYTVSCTATNGTVTNTYSTTISTNYNVKIVGQSSQIGSVTTSTVCKGSEQTIFIHFDPGVPTINITDGPITYTVTNYMDLTYPLGQTIPFLFTPNVTGTASYSISPASCNGISNGVATFNVIDCCPTLITNGDFESTYTTTPTYGFATDLFYTTQTIFNNSIEQFGDYDVDPLSTTSGYFHSASQFWPNHVHNATGKVMQIDGFSGSNTIVTVPSAACSVSPSPAPRVWQQVVSGLQPSTPYFYSFKILENYNNVFTVGTCTATGLNFETSIASNTLTLLPAQTFTPTTDNTVSPTVLDWVAYTYTFTTPSTVNTSNTFSITINQINNFHGGNYDYLLDNITLNAMTPGIQAIGNATICPTSTVQLNAVSNCTTTAYSYQWQPATALTNTASATTANPVANPSTTTVYTLVASPTSTLGIDPTFISTVTVTVNNSPAINITGNTAVCPGASSSTLTANGANTYTWSANAGSATTASVIVTPTVTTTYTVSGNATNCPSVGTQTISITVNNTATTISVTPTSSTVCSLGSAVQIIASGASTYTWMPGSTLSSISSATVTASPPSSTIYTVMGTYNGCIGTNTVSITVLPVPSLTIVVTPTLICSGQTTTLTASGASNYTWSPGGATTSSIVVNPTSNNTYSVAATYTNSCLANQSAQVNVRPIFPVYIIASPTVICANQSSTLNLSSTGASTYTWSTGATTASIVVTPTITTTYSISVTGTNSCVETKTMTLTVNPIPTITITPSAPTVCYGVPTVLTSGTANTYTWSANAGSATTASVSVSPTVTTTYSVTGTNTVGCANTQTVGVTVQQYSCTTGTNPSYTITGVSAGTFSPTTGLITQNMYIGTGTATPTSYTINCPDLRMGPGTSIIVANSATLTINASWLHACAVCSGSMWQGIVVKDGGTLIINNYSIIEDAIQAVYTATVTSGAYTPSWNITNTIFNKNSTDIYADSHTGNFSSNVIYNTIFTCRSLNSHSVTSGTFTAIKADIVAATPINTSTANPTTTTLAGVRSQYGIYLNAAGIFSLSSPIYIGNSAQGNNIFDNMDYGIYNYASSITVKNNRFQNLTGNNQTHHTPIGIGIYAENAAAPKDPTAQIIGNSNTTINNAEKNYFVNCLRGVWTLYQTQVFINDNTFDNETTASSFGTSSLVCGEYGVNNTAFGVGGNTGAFVDKLQFANNTCNNYANGFYHDFMKVNNTASAGSYWYNNTISSYTTSPGTSGNYCNIGLNLTTSVGTETTSVPQDAMKIYQNTITKSTLNAIQVGGIGSASSSGYLTITQNTELGVKYNSSATSYQGTSPIAAVYLANCNYVKVDNNTLIKCTGLSSYPSTNAQYIQGIYLYQSTNCIVTCNSVFDMGEDFVFEGTCSGTTWTRSTMETSRFGLVLRNTGVMGNQGSSGHPIGDLWYKYSTSITDAQTLADNSDPSNATTPSKLYCLAATCTGGSTPLPCQNNWINSGTAYLLGTTTFSTTGTAPTCIGDGGGGRMAAGHATVNSAQDSTAIDSTSLAAMVTGIENSAPLPVYDAETRWAVQHFVSSLDSSIDAATGYDNAKTMAMANLAAAGGDYATALSISNAVVPTNLIETNWQQVNAIWLPKAADTTNTYQYSNTDISTLESIAPQCPLIGGSIVFKARAILSNYYGGVINYPNSCIDSSGNVAKTANINKASLPKNTITVYPNPNNGHMTFAYTFKGEGHLEISDVNGNLVGSYILPEGSSHTEVKNNDLKNGVYFYRIMDANGVVLKIGKIVVMQ